MLLSRLAVFVLALGGSMSIAISAAAKERRSTGPTLSWAREIWPYTHLVVPVAALLAAVVLIFVLLALRSSRRAAARETAISPIEDRVNAG